LANVSHASLTAANLHEPKGAATATAGQIYVANGAGSGAWTTVEGLSITGMIAPFVTPIAPSGWLECDGSAINTSSYPSLYNAMTISQTGTRGAGSPTITGLSSTTGMKAGYYAFGTGIASGTTIVSVDSASQITLSANSASSGSSTVAVSPWLLNTGTIALPNLTTAGRFIRSRTSSTLIGALQADQNQAHTHTATTSSDGAHTHTINVTDPGHVHGGVYPDVNAYTTGGGANNQTFSYISRTAGNTSSATTGITASSVSNGAHTHTLTTSSSGSTEARPVALVAIYCVKT
jgi:hypothetical protein